MKSFRVVCPACDSEFLSYEKYFDHVFLNHTDQPSLRMKVKIRKQDTNEIETNNTSKKIGPRS